jgi:tetratricopeptide (TPR) repeat protein
MPLLTSAPVLRLAIRNLDPVVATFPSLVAARLARATAYHRLWLNSAPVQVQGFRAALHTYAARFALSAVRPGDMGDAMALHRARRDYGAILEGEEIPAVLSGRALLEAYCGRYRRARNLIRRAVALSPEPILLNDQGVVLALSGSLHEALAVFDAGIERGPAPGLLALLFNRAKAAALVRRSDRIEVLRQYLEWDALSGWSNEIRRLLGMAPLRTLQASIRIPEIRPGLALGIGAAETLARLGEAENQSSRCDSLMLTFGRGGLRMLFARRRGAVAIDLLSRAAGDVHGVRVGDSVAAIKERFGSVAEIGDDHLVFWSGAWGIGVEFDGDNREIESISVVAA